MAKPREQRVWPAGEMLRRLTGLGISRSTFADQIGEKEQLLRQLDSGRALVKRENVELREKLFEWIELEERLRLANPLPVRPGKTPTPAGAKQRRTLGAWRPGRRRGEVEDASPIGEVAGEGARPASLVGEGGAPVRDDLLLVDRKIAAVQGLMETFDVPEVEPLRSVEGRMTASQVRQLYDFMGIGPRALANRTGVSQLYRDLRRIAHRDGQVKPDMQTWLLRIAEAAARDPEVAAWTRRMSVFEAWRQEISRRLRVMGEEIEAAAPPQERIDAWDAEVDACAQNLPHWMRPKPREAVAGVGEGGGRVPNPRGPMTLEEILGDGDE